MKASILAVLLLASGLTAAPALALGDMVETSIRDRDSFAAAPAVFKVTFQHESAITSLMLMTADNRQIALSFKPSKTMATEFSIPLPQLAKGVYTLAWKSVAKDGHAMPGAVRFTVTGG